MADLCPYGRGKIRHATRIKAALHLKHLRATRREGYAGTVYRCQYCGGFHVGTPRTKSQKGGAMAKKPMKPGGKKPGGGGC